MASLKTWLLLSFFYFCFTISCTQVEGGLSSRLKSKISGGSDAKHGEFPWLVSIRTKLHKMSHICGGTVIGDKWILTAAHCFRYNRQPKDHDVVSGEFDLFKKEDIEQVVGVERIILHQEFRSSLSGNDIALLKLKQPLKFDDYTRPIRLPRINEIKVNKVCTAAGWGQNSEQETSGKLQKVDLSLISSDECKKFYDDLHDKEICFSGKGKDVCSGDSGGPMSCLLNNNEWVIGGIVSKGKQCDKDTSAPGIYTSVVPFLEWIEQEKRKSGK